MSELDGRSTKQLFNDWRQGDGQAGQAMAQRFADWYYAITTSRLGETRGREPCDIACQRFGEGIVNVTESRALVGWAHEIVLAELENAGSRATDGDEPNAYTDDKYPKDLLVRARMALPSEVNLLEATYGGRVSRQELDEMAAPLGGNPLGVLKARYRIKQWLRDNEGVPFEVAPENPILDRAPLPLYESGHMATDQEETNFEQWMISDIDLCKDIAEFAHFSIALRGGLPAHSARPQGEPTDPAPQDTITPTKNPGCLARLFGG
ncbi:MAG TPA: hypothetical protein ENK18_06680 [Deltaproteobacteria bacterium]|nr:hypothetical protein [Deltaproteobacteria bacterium]